MKGIFRFLSGIMGITWLLWGGCRPTIKEHDQSLSDITVIDLNTLEEADLLFRITEWILCGNLLSRGML